VPEELGLEEVLRNCGAVDGNERLVVAGALAVHEAGHDLLAGAGLAGNQNAGLAGRDLLGEAEHAMHRLMLEDQGVAFLGDRLQDRGDEFGVGRQGNVFLGAGTDRRHRRLGVGADAAGDHGHVYALALQALDEGADIEADLHHHYFRTLAGAQVSERNLGTVGMRHLGATAHRDLSSDDNLAVERADNQETHLLYLPWNQSKYWSRLAGGSRVLSTISRRRGFSCRPIDAAPRR
jgi:hypothetical protein